MMTIDEEVEHLVAFLSHPAGFDVDMSGLLCIRPIDESSPPQHWEVDWTGVEDGMECEYHKQFTSLQEAAQFFVEKRRYLVIGLDFESILMKEEPNE